ncbi:putative Zinc finger protein 294 [Danaus plexippus plexippus]|uniref:E3 ubiquitin-protein ligase listerin n=1 Tax=Danaus plexippus plexippus TaxID=278856 RepID=A0A212EWC5_DANPL|nr:putative Zinc finger protein 294 [Danaus plexippus plexippus]
MGGKTKQSQRTKNNVRPSSSGRSAEILSNSLKLDSSYVITGSGKVLPALFPTLTTTPIDQGLSPEYTVCFKKFHKKDPITKTKALQELTELVKNGDKEEVVAALPSWANIYQTLTVDGDRRVRETVQTCHSAVISTCGRRAAPVLRRILPAWLLASVDDHGPAQTAALNSLQNTFPDGKLAEAISFCKSEILSLLIDNLTGNAEAMLSNKVEDVEERSMQVSRLLGCSLLALRAVLLKLTEHLQHIEQLEEQRDWLTGQLEHLLGNNAFWKLATHESQHVRVALLPLPYMLARLTNNLTPPPSHRYSWYSCMGSLWSVYPGAPPPSHSRRLLRALTNRPESGASPWSAMLLIANSHPNWHEWLDKKDLLVKRVVGVLESGGGGECRVLSESLRGLLSSLPRDMKTKDFWSTFFDAAFKGLKNKNLLSSRSERQGWISNIAECLKYVSEQNDDWVVEVITEVHRTWLELVATAQDRLTKTNMIKHSGTQMAMLVKHWLQNSKDLSDEKYDQLIRNYWQNIGSTIASHIDILSLERSDIANSIEAHTVMLKALKTGYHEDARQQRCIKFADEDDKTQKEPIKVELDRRLQERFEHNLHDVADNTCCSYFDFAQTKQVSKWVFPSLQPLLAEFECERLFRSLARHFGCQNVFGFYDKVLKTWLSGDTMRCNALVDVMFTLAQYLNESELEAMYDSFQQFPPQVVEWCLSPSLSLSRGSSSIAASWLRGPVCEAAVVGLSKRPEDPAARQLLLECMAVDERGELRVSESTVVKVLSVLSSLMPVPPPSEVSSLASSLVLSLHATNVSDRCQQLVLVMFELVLKHPKSSSLHSSLLECLRVLGRECSSEALRRARAWLYHDIEELDMSRIEHVASLCPHVLLPSESVPADTSDLSALTRALMDDQLRPTVPLEVFSLRCDCIFGNINCPIEDDNDVVKTIVATSDMDHAELSKMDLMVHVYKSLFRSFFIQAIVTRHADIMADVFFREQYALCLYEYVIIKTLYDRYAFWCHYEIIYETKNRMDLVLDDIFTKTPYKHKASLLIYLSEQAAAKGYYWSYATRLFDDKVQEYVKMNPDNEPICEVEKEVCVEADLSKQVLDSMCIEKLKDIMTGNGFFHSLQAERGGVQRTRYMVMLRSVFAAHSHEPDVLRAALSPGWGSKHTPVDLYYTHNHVMLYERELIAAPWSQIISNAAIVDFLIESVERGWEMSAAEWDFTTITLCSLITSLRNSAEGWEATKVSALARPVLQLLSCVSSFIRELPRRCVLEQPAPHVAALVTEWKDIFAPDINRNLFEMLVIVLKSADEHMTSSRVATIAGLITATKHMDYQHVKTRSTDTELRNIASVAIRVLDRMTHHAYKYLAFHTLDLISKHMVLDDAEKLSEWSARSDDSPRPEFSLSYYDDTLIRLQEMVDAALEHVDGVCGSRVVWLSAGGRVSCSLLLLAAAELRHAAAARTDLAHMYIELFRENKYAEWWMQTTLKLLPQEVAAYALEETDTLPDHCLKDFDILPELNVYGWCNGRTVTRLSCWVLTATLGGSGAGGRAPCSAWCRPR